MKKIFYCLLLIAIPYSAMAQREIVHDHKGNKPIGPEYDFISDYVGDGLRLVGKKKKYGFINTADKEVIPCQYDDAYPFSDGLALVCQKKKYGFINKNNQAVVELIYDEVKEFSEDLAYVKRGSKVGFVDKMGNLAIPLLYDEAGNFSEGLAYAKTDRKFGFIDKKGTIVISFDYDNVFEDFSKGKVLVEQNGKKFYIENPTRPAPTSGGNTENETPGGDTQNKKTAPIPGETKETPIIGEGKIYRAVDVPAIFLVETRLVRTG